MTKLHAEEEAQCNTMFLSLRRISGTVLPIGLDRRTSFEFGVRSRLCT